MVNVSLAQTSSPFVGTWKLNVAKSDLGSEPPPKESTITISKDTADLFSMHGEGEDSKGNRWSWAWDGPPDGKMHPFKGSSGQQSVRKEGRVLIRHAEFSDGSSFDARATVSADGNTAVEETTWKSKDGKETKSKSVVDRVSTKVAN